MPKLTAEILERNKFAILDTSIECFLKYGYNGVSIRQISKEGNLSIGNIYNYFPDKLSVFTSALDRLSEDFAKEFHKQSVDYFDNNTFPHNLQSLAGSIQKHLSKHHAYIKMVYIDIVEFNGAHVKDMFSNLYSQFKQLNKEGFKALGNIGIDESIDPCFAFTSIFMQFYQYFITTKIFNAKNPYGPITDKQVIQNMIHMLELSVSTKAEKKQKGRKT